VEKEAVVADNTVLKIESSQEVFLFLHREGLLSTVVGNIALSDMIEKGYFSPFETLDELI